MVTKLFVRFHQGASKHFKKKISRAMAAIPPEINKFLNGKGYSIKTGVLVSEIFPDLNESHPRGWPKESTWSDVPAIHESLSKIIGIASHHYQFMQPIYLHQIGKKKLVENEIIEYCLRHEIGHAVDYSCGLISSNDNGFLIAYKKDRIKQNSKRNQYYFIQKGEAGRRELFAELFSILLFIIRRPRTRWPSDVNDMIESWPNVMSRLFDFFF